MPAWPIQLRYRLPPASHQSHVMPRPCSFGSPSHSLRHGATACLPPSQATRKLQGEIDRTLKKVQEGVEQFDEIWEKVYSAQNQNQKEKFESELKAQIKKLQRYRDDIKTWIANSDIKDKRPLMDARKLIETEMERFKVCEKEFKTKAFSKEGLASAPKEDPKEKEKNKTRKWVGNALDTLQESKDKFEAELETINSGKVKKKKDSGAQKWEDLIERCKYHEERLELILRLIDNEGLSPEQVDACKDQLEFLFEKMTEGDYEEVDGIDDDGIYEELGLDDHMSKEAAGAGSGDEEGGGASSGASAEKAAGGGATPDKKAKPKTAAEKEEEERKEKEKLKAKSSSAELPSINAAALKTKPLPKPEPAPVPPPKPAAPAAPLAAPKLPGPGPAVASAVPVTTAAAAAAAAATRSKAAAVPLTAAAATARQPAPLGAAAVLSGRAGGLPAGPNPGLAVKPAVGLPAATGLPPAADGVAGFAAAAGGGLGSAVPRMGAAGLGQSNLDGGPSSGVVSGGLPAPKGVVSGASLKGGASEVSLLPGLGDPRDPRGDHVDGSGGGVHAGTVGAAHSAHSLVPGGAAAAGVPARTGGASAGAADLDAGLLEELDTFDDLVNLGAMPTGGAPLDPAHARQLLALSLLNMPETADSERPRTYVPRNPYPTPNSFPQTPAAVFDAPSTFDRFDTDTLFFIFYYQQGTYAQYLAAKQLKRQSWRYHKKYLTWFQRHEEPKVTAEDYEQGTYIYFDYETGWCQRIKADFTFEYGFLEDELSV